MSNCGNLWLGNGYRAKGVGQQGAGRRPIIRWDSTAGTCLCINVERSSDWVKGPDDVRPLLFGTT